MTNLTFKTEISDWQGEDRKPDAPASVDVTVECLGQVLVVTAADGRKFGIELQNGDLRVMAYENDSGKETPVVLTVPPEGGITVDRRDYDAEPRDDASFDL